MGVRQHSQRCCKMIGPANATTCRSHGQLNSSGPLEGFAVTFDLRELFLKDESDEDVCTTQGCCVYKLPLFNGAAATTFSVQAMSLANIYSQDVDGLLAPHNLTPRHTVTMGEPLPASLLAAARILAKGRHPKATDESLQRIVTGTLTAVLESMCDMAVQDSKGMGVGEKSGGQGQENALFDTIDKFLSSCSLLAGALKQIWPLDPMSI